MVLTVAEFLKRDMDLEPIYAYVWNILWCMGCPETILTDAACE